MECVPVYSNHMEYWIACGTDKWSLNNLCHQIVQRILLSTNQPTTSSLTTTLNLSPFLHPQHGSRESHFTFTSSLNCQSWPVQEFQHEGANSSQCEGVLSLTGASPQETLTRTQRTETHSA